MITFLRRIGILFFSAISLFTGLEAAKSAAGGAAGVPSGLRFMLTGAVWACLALLLIGEVSSWLARLPVSTRRETTLARIAIIDPGEAEPLVMQDGYSGHSLDVDDCAWEAAQVREWVDRRGREPAEVVRTC
jgi:hypothetical protein